MGVSVTNALARKLEVSVFRDGQFASLTFSGGDVTVPLEVRKLASGERRHGTRVTGLRHHE